MTTRQRRVLLGLFTAYLLYGASWLFWCDYAGPAIVTIIIAVVTMVFAPLFTEGDVND